MYILFANKMSSKKILFQNFLKFCNTVKLYCIQSNINANVSLFVCLSYGVHVFVCSCGSPVTPAHALASVCSNYYNY